MLNDKQFTRLAKLYMDTVFRLAFNYTKSRSEADDITQDVLIKLYHTDKAFDSEKHIKHWLIRVTINECKKHFYRRGNELSRLRIMLRHSLLYPRSIVSCSMR